MKKLFLFAVTMLVTMFAFFPANNVFAAGTTKDLGGKVFKFGQEYDYNEFWETPDGTSYDDRNDSEYPYYGNTKQFPEGYYAFTSGLGSPVDPDGECYVKMDDFYSQVDRITNLIIIDESGKDITKSWEDVVFYLSPNQSLSISLSDEREEDHLGLIKLEETDYQAPIVNGSTYYLIDVDNMISKEYIVSQTTAIDDTDGYVQVTIEGGNYDPANRTIGRYNLILAATDSAGNKTTLEVTCVVADVTAPSILGVQDYTFSYNDADSAEEILSRISVSDNYDQEITYQITNDTYSSAPKRNGYVEVGDYEIVFQATDSSKNSTKEITSHIKVEDKVAPVLIYPAELEVSNQTLLSKEELLKKITSNDEYCGSCKVTIKDIDFEKYVSGYTSAGSRFTIELSTEDEFHNIKTASMTIVVVDKTDPTIVLKDVFLCLDEGQDLTEDLLKEYLAIYLNIDVSEIVAVSGSFDVKKIGTYAMNLTLKDGSVQPFIIQVGRDSFNSTFTTVIDVTDWNYWKSCASTYVSGFFTSDWSWNALYWITGGVVGLAVLFVVMWFFRKNKK